MRLLLNILVLSSVVILNLDLCLGICGQCGAFGIVCLTPNQFSACFNGVASPVVNICPPGQVCSDSRAVCAVPSATQVADCPSPPTCGVCSADNRFACVNLTTFAYCFGTTVPSTILDNCPAGQVCDINAAAPGFCNTDTTVGCAEATTTTQGPITTTTEGPLTTTTQGPITTTATQAPVTTTTPIPPSNYCAAINARSGTRYATPFDSLCKQFVYCFVNNGVLSGSYYRCSGQTVFNNVTGFCITPPVGFVCPLIPTQ